MTNLANKFATFEAQSAAQHTELMTALNTIAYALGAPPTTPTTTLADLSTQLDALINGIALLYSANTTFHTNTLSTLGQINTNTDLMLTNNSLNAQRILAAIYATFCECNTDIPVLAPPIDVTPTIIVDEAKCRRIQFYLSVFSNWLNKIANYGNTGAAITGGTLAYLLSVAAADAGIIATGVEVGAVGGIPGVVAGAVVGLIVVAVYTFGGSVLVDYANQFSDPTLQNNLLMALYNEDNAESGYVAFQTTIVAGMDWAAAQVIYTLWWTAWSNDIYSGSPVVDDSAFDGTICVPEPDTGCLNLNSSYVIVEPRSGSDSHVAAIIVPAGFAATNSITYAGWPPYVFGDAVVFVGDFAGYTVKLITGVYAWVDVITVSGNNRYQINAIYQEGYTEGIITVIGSTTHMIIFQNADAGNPPYVPFSVELCAPAL